MQEVVNSLEEWGDWVIVGTPLLLAATDAAAVARGADGVLTVAQAVGSTCEAGKKAVKLLEEVGAKTTGVVVRRFDEARAGSVGYGYSSGYYYASYYSIAPGSERRSRSHDNGAPAVGVEVNTATPFWVPEECGGRDFAGMLRKVLTGIMAFFLVVAIAAAVALFPDQYFGWGLLQMLSW